MSAYRKVNGQMISVTTEGHPQYYFDTLAQAEAALSQLEEGADVFIKEGSNEDLLPRVEQAEEDIVQINSGLSDITNDLTNVNNKLSVSTVSVTNGTNRELQINNVKKIGNVCYVNLAFAQGPTAYGTDYGLARFDGISANGRAYLIGYITNPSGNDFTVRQLYVENGDNLLKLAESQLTSGYLMIVQGCFVTN